MSDFAVTRPQRQVVYSSELSQWLKDAADEVEERDDSKCWFVRKGEAAAAALNAWVGKRSLQRQTAAVRVLESDRHDVWGTWRAFNVAEVKKSQKLSPSSYSWADKEVFWTLLDHKKPQISKL